MIKLVKALKDIASRLSPYGELVRSLERLAHSEANDDAQFDAKHPRGRRGRFINKNTMFQKSAPDFHKALVGAKESQPEHKRWRVDIHEVTDYDGTKNLVDDRGSTVSIKPDGDIISVCKNTSGSAPGVSAVEMMSLAVAHGGTKLDSFEGNHSFYRKCGFEPISWTPFNEEYSPEGWDKNRDMPEDVIFYAYTGNRKRLNPHEEAEDLAAFKRNTPPRTGETGYDDAMKDRDDFIQKQNQEGK